MSSFITATRVTRLSILRTSMCPSSGRPVAYLNQMMRLDTTPIYETSRINQFARHFSDSSNAAPPNANEGQVDEDAAGTEETTDETNTVPPKEENKFEAEIRDLKSQLLRSLADQENTRRIAKKDVDSAKKFATQSFAKSLLEVSDNLERALQAVPQDILSQPSSDPSSTALPSAENLQRVLLNLYEGIQMTEDGLNKAFDPNRHDALFEYPDPNLAPGTVGQVMKTGYLLHQRVLRPAEVGVIKKV
jgi:molecular chaperone GrpE